MCVIQFDYHIWLILIVIPHVASIFYWAQTAICHNKPHKMMCLCLNYYEETCLPDFAINSLTISLKIWTRSLKHFLFSEILPRVQEVCLTCFFSHYSDDWAYILQCCKKVLTHYTRNISVYVKYRGSISSRFSRNSEANGYLADPNIELHNR